MTDGLSLPRRAEVSPTVAVVLAAATFATVGACLTVPGTLLPVLVDALHIRLVEAGSMFALQGIAYLLSVVAAGPVIRRCGLRAVLSVGMLGFAAGFAGFGSVSTWSGGAVMIFVSGLGFGVVEVALNSLLIAIGGARRANLLNLAHLFFGVGAFVGPAAAARAVAGGVSWRVVFAVAGALTAAVGLGWTAQPIAPSADADASAPRTDSAPLRSRLVAVLAVTLGLYVGAEMGIGGWLSKYMVAVRGLDLTYAGVAVSLYWMGLAAGRLVLSATSHYVDERRLIVGLAVGAAAALALALLARSPAVSVAAFGATGLGFSGIFPGVIALAGTRHPRDVAAVTSVVVTGGAVGGITIPWAMSAVAEEFGLVAGMSFYLIVCALMTVLAAAICVLARPAHATPCLAVPTSS